MQKNNPSTKFHSNLSSSFFFFTKSCWLTHRQTSADENILTEVITGATPVSWFSQLKLRCANHVTYIMWHTSLSTTIYNTHPPYQVYFSRATFPIIPLCSHCCCSIATSCFSPSTNPASTCRLQLGVTSICSSLPSFLCNHIGEWLSWNLDAKHWTCCTVAINVWACVVWLNYNNTHIFIRCIYLALQLIVND